MTTQTDNSWFVLLMEQVVVEQQPLGGVGLLWHSRPPVPAGLASAMAIWTKGKIAKEQVCFTRTVPTFFILSQL